MYRAPRHLNSGSPLREAQHLLSPLFHSDIGHAWRHFGLSHCGEGLPAADGEGRDDTETAYNAWDSLLQ